MPDSVLEACKPIRDNIIAKLEQHYALVVFFAFRFFFLESSEFGETEEEGARQTTRLFTG